jgi:hypothetical protein
MEAMRFHLTVESETINIPQLKQFIGKRVEIILIEDSPLETENSTRYKKIKNLKGKISFNEDALPRLRQDSIL